VRQRVNNRAEYEVFGLLLARELVKRHHAMMLFQVRALLRPVGPSVCDLLRHPAFMAGLRAGVWVFNVQLHAHQGRVALPLRSLFPCRLTVIAKRLAIGAVDFVSNAGNLLFVHFNTSSFVPASQCRLTVQSSGFAPLTADLNCYASEARLLGHPCRALHFHHSHPPHRFDIAPRSFFVNLFCSLDDFQSQGFPFFRRRHLLPLASCSNCAMRSPHN